MNLAVIGASGSIGRAITHMIVAERLLESRHKLVLVGNEGGRSARSLYGLAADLLDGYAEICPEIEVVLQPEEIRAEYIIMAGSAGTMGEEGRGHSSGSPAASANPAGPQPLTDRDALAAVNYNLFERYASAIARHGHGHEIAICVSNPVELAVAVFARHLGRRRAIGMGAFLDSLRFRKELALDLGIERSRIHAFIAGEHGGLMAPLWSTVHIYGMEDSQVQAAVRQVRKGHQTRHFHKDFTRAIGSLKGIIKTGDIRAAYAFVETFPPDLRVALRPYVTHYSGAKTVAGTARATLDLLRMVMLGHDAFISGQVCLDGDCYGLHSTVGIPFVIGNKGVDRYIALPLWPEEQELLTQVAEKIQAKIAASMQH